MTQKYPNDDLPYRFRRKPPKRCCVSRRGIAKQFWPDEASAVRFIADKCLEAVLEPYSCKQHAGNWHVRQLRK